MQNYNHNTLKVNSLNPNRLSTLFPKISQNSPQLAIQELFPKTAVKLKRPVVVNGEIVVRPIMYVALSYDHRTIDGKDSVSFLVRVKQLLEDPTRILLGV
jgi:pyruvate/2-oxoglutarate dehydrogenase complex dihydrolipoamide acyltransferase (E2) component